MKVLIDGVEVPIQNDVKIIVELDDQELHVTAGADGISYDLIEDDEIVAASAVDWASIFGDGHIEQDEGPVPDYFKTKTGSCTLVADEDVIGFGLCRVYQCTDGEAVQAFLEDVGGALHPLGEDRVILREIPDGVLPPNRWTT